VATLPNSWQNLTPACSKCNTYKGNQFPIAALRCLGPEPGNKTTPELNAYEQPLLLHPGEMAFSAAVMDYLYNKLEHHREELKRSFTEVDGMLATRKR